MENTQTQAPQVEVACQHKENSKFCCDICPQRCKLIEGGIGVCGGRQVINDKFIAVNYAQVSSLHLDPMEKKPLYHFFPDSDILSVGPNGCNLSCVWCQNWQISQDTIPTRIILPEELGDMVDALDGIGAAYTYAEPLVWYEYILDAGRVLHERGLVNVLVSNGYINSTPLKAILEITDAFNIDLKSFDKGCYKKFCGGELDNVLNTIKMTYDAGVHVEITHLIVTGINDDLKKIEPLIKWIADIDPTIPLHLSRYFPNNKYFEEPTDAHFMMEAYQLARTRLDWVYLGNVQSPVGQDSLCPECSAPLVKRSGYNTEIVNLDGDHCRGCGRKVNFHMNKP